MVFVFRVDTKKELRRKLEESTSGCVAITLKISIKLVTQGICDVLGGGRRKELRA